MKLTLTLSPEREARIQAQARMSGLSPEEYALRLLDGASVADAALCARNATKNGASAQDRLANDPTLALFSQWAAEDADDAPEEISRRAREDEETAAHLRRNRFNVEGRTDFQHPAEEFNAKDAA